MASDQEVAQQILGIKQAQQAGQLDDQAAAELMAEQGLQAPVEAASQEVPASLAANPPPEALTAGPISSDFVVPQIDPQLAAAAQQADAQERARSTLHVPAALAPIIPNELAANPPQDVAVSEEPSEETPPPPASQEQVSAQANADIVQPVRQAIAENKAMKTAQQDLQAEFAKQQADYQQQQEEIQRQLLQKDDEVRQRSLAEIMQRGTFGDKLTATIAVLLGGLSQGLTGAKTNPVLDFIDKQVEMQAQKDKLSAENKLSLRKQLMDIAQSKMQNLANKSQDLYHKQALEQQAAELEVKKQEVLGAQQLKQEELFAKKNTAHAQADAERGGPITDLSQLSEKQNDRVQRLPDGSYRLAKNESASKKLDEYRSNVEPALESLSRIKQLSREYSMAKRLNPLDPQRAKIETELVGLVGNLRLPFTGPGQLLEKEYDRLRDAIGNPNKILTLQARETAALMQVEKKLNSDLKSEFKRAGIDLPKTRREQLMEKFGK